MNDHANKSDLAFLSLLYDTFRSAKLNEIYYFNLYNRVRRQTFFFDMTTAFMSVTVVFLEIVEQNLYIPFPLRYVKQILLLVLTIFCVVRPVSRLSDKQYSYLTLYRNYAQLRLDLERIVTRIRISQEISHEDKADFERSLEQMRQLANREDTPPSPRLIAQLQAIVSAQLPAENFWWPDEKISTPTR
jgi:hypothetical protein